MKSYRNIQSVERALAVLLALNDMPLAKLQALEARTGLPAPTLVRILETLVDLGYVTRVSRRSGYTLTRKVTALSAGYVGFPAYYGGAVEVMKAVTAKLQWPTALATLEDCHMVVRISTLEDSPHAHARSTLNKRLSLLERAHGRAYLAHCPEDERRELLQRLIDYDYPSLGIEALLEKVAPVLDRTRSNGYAERARDLDPQTSTIAIPLMSGETVFATIGMTFFRRARPDRSTMLAELRTAAEKIVDLHERSA